MGRLIAWMDRATGSTIPPLVGVIATCLIFLVLLTYYLFQISKYVTATISSSAGHAAAPMKRSQRQKSWWSRSRKAGADKAEALV